MVAGVPTTYTQDLAAPLPVVLQAKTGITTTKYLYSLGTRPLAQNSTAWEYLLPDALGSVRQIADANGNVTLAESYEPYGSVLTSTGSATSIFGFSGEEADNTGLIYLRARYMRPALGAFLVADKAPMNMMQPSAGGMYLYANGNPVNHTDPSGLCVFCDSGDAVKVDGRVNGTPDQLIVRARPDENAPEIARIPDNHRVRIADSRPTDRGQDGWRKVSMTSRMADGGFDEITGWVPNIKLLDNCDGPQGTFTCLPATGDIRPTLGFGPNQWALDHCGHPVGRQAYGPNCKYTDLRGLHNGLDFGVDPGNSLVWMGTGDGTVVNNWPADAADNIEIQFDGQGVEVIFGHTSSTYRGASVVGQKVKPGQTIGTSGGTHLHLGVRNGRVFYNPLNYFASALQSQTVAVMDPYPEPYNPYSMISFDADAVPDDENFWTTCPPDSTGITWSPGMIGPE